MEGFKYAALGSAATAAGYILFKALSNKHQEKENCFERVQRLSGLRP